uniref:SF3 helicase domain-containing protein n=1 Tax=viral metagenome TaxID=1070528 RepID=A0A6C0H609_9ZZZZ
MASKYDMFMNKYVVSKGQNYTHTRMSGGVYNIPSDKYKEFYNLYYEHVIKNNNNESLVEKQNKENGPILIDFDFRYEDNVIKRHHDKDLIYEVINKYLTILKDEIIFEENRTFPIYVMERKMPYKKNKIVKDGFHIVIGIKLSLELKKKIRNKMIETLDEELEKLPLIDDNYENIFDNTIVSGSTGWMMIGSRKPNLEPYLLSTYYELQYDANDEGFIVNEIEMEINKDNFMKMTAQYDDFVEFKEKTRITKKRKMVEQVEEKEEEEEKEYTTIIEPSVFIININKIISSIKNENDLQNRINEYIMTDEKIKNIHLYVELLSEKYYEPGSHLLNRKVAFALKNTDPRLFLSWIKLRSKANDFCYCDISELYRQWNQYFNNKQEKQLTANSIKFWAKEDNYEEYIKINNNTLNDMIDNIIKDPTDYDLAKILHHMYKDYCVCTDIKKKELYWYHEHHWMLDKGVKLRHAISNELHMEFIKKINQLINESKRTIANLESIDKTKEVQELYKSKMKTIKGICTRLKSTDGINKIMNESYYIFYDYNFVKMADENPYLVCFTNGVVDFKNKCFRAGKPDDYITKCTNIPFIENENDIDQNIVSEIKDFLTKLFPIPELYDYMWDHMSSIFYGTNINGTFNIYKGDGANGKSILQKLLSKVFGEYCLADIKTSLITFRETDMEKPSPTLNSLKGIRLALLQELTKCCKMNDKIVKNLATKEPMNIRNLYDMPYVMILQAMFILSTNYLPSTDNVTDHGLARRMRIIPFISKFVDNYDKNKKYKSQYTYPKNLFLEEKIPLWVPTFAHMLVMNAFKTNGVVNSEKCKIVMEFSDKFMKEQDIFAYFIKDCVVADSDGIINKTDINEEFKKWFSNNYNYKDTKPKMTELHEYISEYFDIEMIKNKWKGISISNDFSENNDDKIDDLES